MGAFEKIASIATTATIVFFIAWCGVSIASEKQGDDKEKTLVIVRAMFDAMKSLQTGECDIEGTFSFPPFTTQAEMTEYILRWKKGAEDIDIPIEDKNKNIQRLDEIFNGFENWDYGSTRGGFFFQFTFDYPAERLFCRGTYPQSVRGLVNWIPEPDREKKILKNLGPDFEKVKMANAYPIFTLFLKNEKESYSWHSYGKSIGILPPNSIPKGHFYDIRALPFYLPCNLFASNTNGNGYEPAISLDAFEKGWLQSIAENPERWSVSETDKNWTITSKSHQGFYTIVVLDKTKKFLPVSFGFGGYGENPEDRQSIKIASEYKEENGEWRLHSVDTCTYTQGETEEEVKLTLHWKSYNKPIAKETFEMRPEILPCSLILVDRRLPNNPVIGGIRKESPPVYPLESKKKKLGIDHRHQSAGDCVDHLSPVS